MGQWEGRSWWEIAQGGVIAPEPSKAPGMALGMGHGGASSQQGWTQVAKEAGSSHPCPLVTHPSASASSPGSHPRQPPWAASSSAFLVGLYSPPPLPPPPPHPPSPRPALPRGDIVASTTRWLRASWFAGAGPSLPGHPSRPGQGAAAVGARPRRGGHGQCWSRLVEPHRHLAGCRVRGGGGFEPRLLALPIFLLQMSRELVAPGSPRLPHSRGPGLPHIDPASPASAVPTGPLPHPLSAQAHNWVLAKKPPRHMPSPRHIDGTGRTGCTGTCRGT